MNIIETNREREIWLTDGVHAYFIPKGWVDHFSDGVESGIGYINEDGIPEPEAYCYAPTHIYVNSPVETMFVSVETLERMVEIDQAEAERIHPKLAEHLITINSEA
jgi:hypothetical protein